jgi:uncharacterized protein (DUF111 family)
MKIFHTDHIKLPFEIISRKVLVETKNTQLEMEVQVKYLKNDNDQVISLKAEYEDIKKIALKLESRGISIPLAKLKTVIEAEAYKKVLDNDNMRIKVN